MASNPITRVLIEFVICGICESKSENPKLLTSCGHVFCSHCLTLWMRTFLPTKRIICPECESSCGQRDITPNFLASRILDVLAKQPTEQREPPKDSGSTPEANSLEHWVTREGMPKEIYDVIISKGYASSGSVFSMSQIDVEKLGLKDGHGRKLWKSIVESKGKESKENLTKLESTLGNQAKPRETERSEGVLPLHYESGMMKASKNEEMSEWQVLEEWRKISAFRDDQFLSSGTIVSSTLEHSAGSTRAEFEKNVQHLIEVANTATARKQYSSAMKSELLQGLVILLCKAGAYKDAKYWAAEALKLSSGPKQQTALKNLLIYANFNRLKTCAEFELGECDSFIKRYDRSPNLTKKVEEWDRFSKLYEKCASFIKKCRKLLEEQTNLRIHDERRLSSEQLAKVNLFTASILISMAKMAHIYYMINSKTFKMHVVGDNLAKIIKSHESAGLSRDENLMLQERARSHIEKSFDCNVETQNVGILSVILMTSARLFRIEDQTPNLEKIKFALMLSREYCLTAYGEKSSLNAELYYHLGTVLIDTGESEKANGCFQRALTISKEIFGEHHLENTFAEKLITKEINRTKSPLANSTVDLSFLDEKLNIDPADAKGFIFDF